MSFLPSPFFLALLQTSNISVDVSGGGDGQIQMNLPVQMLILLTLLTFLPSIIISLSSFTRIIIIFHFLRQALGTQQAPSDQILIGLALFLSFYGRGCQEKQLPTDRPSGHRCLDSQPPSPLSRNGCPEFPRNRSLVTT